MTTDRRKGSQTGNQDMAKDHEVDRRRDGETTSCRRKESLGAEMPDSETTGDVMRRATSCSGWTEPRYNGISTSTEMHLEEST